MRIVLLKVGGNGEPGLFFMYVLGTFEGSRTQVISRVYPGFLATRQEKVYCIYII